MKVLRSPLAYAARTYGMTRQDLFDVLDEAESGNEAKAAAYMVAFMDGLTERR